MDPANLAIMQATTRDLPAAVIVLAAALLACGGSSAYYHAVTGPDGQPATLISCKEAPDCYDTMSSSCRGSGWQILSGQESLNSSRRVALVYRCLYGTLQAR